ncbi:MAG: helix-turn-helix transcriptional regulator [Bauldia sp.]|nr:helix-turn-helix transcriptional regulator [Bauldia sp.]
MITSEQIRAARELAHWDQAELAERSGLALSTIKRIEERTGDLKVQPLTFAALLRTFATVGIDLVGLLGLGEAARASSPLPPTAPRQRAGK